MIMKRIGAVLLAAVLCLMPLTAIAADLPEESLIKMGDVNGDGRVSAADARTALRISAQLDSSQGISLLSADTDADGHIRSSDARSILRVSANLTSFCCGFDGEGGSHAITALQNKHYSLTATFEGFTFTIVANGDDVFLYSDEIAEEFASSAISDCGVMLIGGVVYAAFTTSGGKAAMQVPESLYEEMGITDEDISNITDMIARIVPSDPGDPVKVRENGEEYICYNYELDGSQYTLYIDMLGAISKIDCIYSNGRTETVVEFEEISMQIPEGMFDLSTYDLM